MPDFAYQARSLTGQLVEGTLNAGSEREAIANLTASELFPLRVKAASRQSKNGSPRVKSRYVTPVYSQLAALLRSGVPMLRSLEVIHGQASNAGLKAVLEDVRNRVEDGSTLADAMGRHPRAFSELATSIVRAGGEGGFLEESLERVAVFTDQQDDLRSKVIGAMVYPLVLITIGVLVVGGLILFAVPKVEQMFDGRDRLPVLTQALLGFSDFLWSYGWLVAIALVAGAYA
ncbi:MAG: type II secretion system F family protein, partial [Planctomycetota bacterium]